MPARNTAVPVIPRPPPRQRTANTPTPVSTPIDGEQAPPMPLKLNLGCGPLRLDGELGVDLYPGPACDVVADITGRLPFDDGAAVQVRLDHVLEHIDRRLGLRVLREAHRLLTVDGVVIVGVPDLAQYCAAYAHACEREDMQLKVDVLHGLYGAQTHPGEYHRAGYDPQTLKDIMLCAGFDDIEVVDDNAEWRTEGYCITAKGVKRGT